jgi:hypothetical protein
MTEIIEKSLKLSSGLNFINFRDYSFYESILEINKLYSYKNITLFEFISVSSSPYFS